jgi:hypothetical protein
MLLDAGSMGLKGQSVADLRAEGPDMFLAALPAIGERIDHDVIEQEQANAYADGDEQIFFAIFSFHEWLLIWMADCW